MRNTLNAPITDRQFQWTAGVMVIRNYHWLNSTSWVLISTCSTPLVQTGESKQFSLFDLDLQSKTNQGQGRPSCQKSRSNGSNRSAHSETDRHTHTHTDTTKRIISPATRLIKNGTLTHTHTHTHNIPFIQEHVVVEAFFHRRTVAQMSPVMPLHGLTEDVRAGMPEDILTCKCTQMSTIHVNCQFNVSICLRHLRQKRDCKNTRLPLSISTGSIAQQQCKTHHPGHRTWEDEVRNHFQVVDQDPRRHRSLWL